MKEIFENLKNNKIIHYIVIIFATIIASIPLLNFKITLADDGIIHILRIIGVDKILKTGIFPPAISSVYCNGFGYAINIFYPPLVTYLPLIIKIFCEHYIDAIKTYTCLTILLSGFSMYYMVKEIANRQDIALISSIIYIFIPYRLETIYSRFAIGEFSAYIFIPLVFMGLHNLIFSNKKKHYFITIGAVGLMLTHTISTEYTAIFAFIYLLCNFNKLKNKEVITKIIINLVFIIMISAFFLGPLLEYRNYSDYIIFSSINMNSTGEHVASEALNISQLFKNPENIEDVSFNIGAVFFVSMLLGIYTYRKMNEENKEIYLAFLLIAIISIFMATKYFPWIIMPEFITVLQFPWRMLQFFEFAMAVLCGYNIIILIENVSKSKIAYSGFLLLIISAIIIGMSNLNYNCKHKDIENTRDLEFQEEVISKDKMDVFSINREYLPCVISNNDMFNYIRNREDKIYILSGNAAIIEETKNNLTLDCKIKNIEEGTIIELPFLNYPGYRITIKTDEYEKNIKYGQSENGFIKIEIPKEFISGELNVKYTGTSIEKVSYIISAISMILFTIYLIYEKKKSKYN